MCYEVYIGSYLRYIREKIEDALKRRAGAWFLYNCGSCFYVCIATVSVAATFSANTNYSKFQPALWALIFEIVC